MIDMSAHLRVADQPNRLLGTLPHGLILRRQQDNCQMASAQQLRRNDLATHTSQSPSTWLQVPGGDHIIGNQSAYTASSAFS